MEKPNYRDDVAVFVDFENVYVSVREKFDAQPNFELIMDRCEDYGRIVIARAYADWYRYPRVTSALFANGVEPMYVPTYYYDREVGRTGRPIKNSVDIHLCIDAMRTLYTQQHIDKFVLVTGDRDFIPLVNAIRQHGKEVIIIGIGGAASAHLAQSADEFLFYEQIAEIKPPQQQRQEQQAPRGDKRERDRADRSDRAEQPERDRSDGNGKVDRRSRDRTDRREAAPQPAPQAETQPEPIEVEPAAPERSVYDTLVDAINLARQRGFVSNLGSLKVLMRELDSGFNESKVKDSNGKPFTKFKDFVKEAERQGKVQIFTNGTVTEVFLPGEDPMRLSQFAEDLASAQAERELENEIEREEAQRAPHADQANLPSADQIEAPTVTVIEDGEIVEAEQPALPVIAETGAAESVTQPDVVEVTPAQDANERSTVRTFNDSEWNVFRGAMSQFTDPVRFADIFTVLRGLRNREVFDLTNNELKELVKQAINRGMLQRTGRGARAYYRLSSQYRIAQDDTVDAPRAEQPDTTAEVTESAAGQVSDEGLAPAARRRRGRSYDAVVRAAEAATGGEEASAGDGEAPTGGEETPRGAATAETTSVLGTTGEGAVQLEDTLADQMATQMADAPAPPKPRRNRRRKPAAAQGEDAPTAESEAAPVAEQTSDSQASAEAGEPGKNGNGTKKRRSRRRKPKAEENGVEATTDAEQA